MHLGSRLLYCDTGWHTLECQSWLQSAAYQLDDLCKFAFLLQDLISPYHKTVSEAAVATRRHHDVPLDPHNTYLAVVIRKIACVLFDVVIFLLTETDTAFAVAGIVRNKMGTPALHPGDRSCPRLPCVWLSSSVNGFTPTHPSLHAGQPQHCATAMGSMARSPDPQSCEAKWSLSSSSDFACMLCHRDGNGGTSVHLSVPLSIGLLFVFDSFL